MEIAAEGQLRIRRMEDTTHDYALLLEWLAHPAVKEWYENREGSTLETIQKIYKPRITGHSYVHPAIIEWEESPVGYLQFYETRLEKDYKVYEELLVRPNVWAIDILLGHTDHMGKGIGSGALKLMLRYLFEEKGARTVAIDPDTQNVRAIRAYEKAGFQKVKILENWDMHGDEWIDAQLMACENPHNPQGIL